jgi:hypothetical protein
MSTMSSQASVHSVDSLKDLRVALALYSEDTLGALGAVESEVRRTVRWLDEERPYYWQDQIKRRREKVSMARAEVFKKNLQKRADYTPPMSEQKENLRKAEASLQDAEKRLALTRKWQPIMKQAVLEYHASVQRLKDLAAADIPRAVLVLSRMIDALEAYLQVAVPTGSAGSLASSGAPASAGPVAASVMATAPFVSIATRVLDEDEAAAKVEGQARLDAEARARAEAGAPRDQETGACSETQALEEADPPSGAPAVETARDAAMVGGHEPPGIESGPAGSDPPPA